MSLYKGPKPDDTDPDWAKPITLVVFCWVAALLLAWLLTSSGCAEAGSLTARGTMTWYPGLGFVVVPDSDLDAQTLHRLEGSVEVAPQ